MAAALAGVVACVGGIGTASAEQGSHVREIVRAYVVDRAPVDALAVDVPALSSFEEAWRESGRAEVAIESREGQRFVGSVPLTVSLLEDGEEIKRAVVTARVKAEAPVWVATRSMSRGTLIRESDVSRERRSENRVPNSMPSGLDSIVGFRTSRAIAAGKVWREEWIDRETRVRRNQHVRLRLRHGAMVIDGSGRAREDGSVGDFIRILNLDSKREIYGEIKPDGVVHVSY